MKKTLPFIFAFCFICGISERLVAQTNYPTSPEAAELVFTDLENFLEAYKKLGSGADSVTILNQYYFDRASVGLKEFIAKHNLTPELMVEALGEHPEDYYKIERFVNNID